MSFRFRMAGAGKVIGKSEEVRGRAGGLLPPFFNFVWRIVKIRITLYL